MGGQDDANQNNDGAGDGSNPVLEQVLQRLREVNECLEGMVSAAESRDVIGQAKGILMERYGISSQEASSLLITAGQHSNVTMSVVAQALVSSGNLPGTH